MMNKNSIDELVRQKMAQGEEPHNLSAWANMERMLDGNNPYAREEKEEKRRPWLFMFLTFALLSSSLVGGYVYFSDNPSAPSSNNLVAQSPSETPRSKSNLTVQTVDNKPTNSSSTGQTTNDFETKDLAQNNSSKSPASYASNKKEDNFAQIAEQNKRNLQNKIAANNKPSNKIAAPIKSLKKQTITAIQEANPSAKQDALADHEKISSQKKASETAKKERQKQIAENKALLAKTKKALEKVSPTITETYEEPIHVTEITNRKKLDAYGNQIVVKDTNKYQSVQQKTREVVNPRYVELTKKQEEAAQRQTMLATSVAMSAPAKPTLPTVKSQESIADPAVSLVQNNETKKQQKGFFSIFKKTVQQANQKAINMTHSRFPIYTGMFVGLNAALVNTQHNFGGFQGGLTAMTPISRILSLSTEARFIHKTNSGYTVTDNQSTIINKYVDAISWSKGEIYTYEIDSVTTGHNLNNWYNLEVPVLLSAQIKKFDLYGGLNVNYGFKMNVNSSKRSNPLTIVDSASYTLPYTERVNTTSKFSPDDFGSRLGLGYTVGGAFNMNNKLYLDLRMSNLFWDNTQGAAKKEISDVFFKLPSFQISVGYRFRSYDRER